MTADALAAAIWMKTLAWCRKHPGKAPPYFNNPDVKKIVSTPMEHPSVISTLEFLRTQGIVVEFCPVDRRGRVSPSELERLIDNDTFLICCMLTNNEIGIIQDMGAIAGIARRRGVPVRSDGLGFIF